MVFALTLEIVAAVLMTWMTWRAATGSLAGNTLVGVRTRIMMSSDTAWRVGRLAALRPTMIAGTVTVLWCSLSLVVGSLRTPISQVRGGTGGRGGGRPGSVTGTSASGT